MKIYDYQLCATRLTQENVPPWFLGLLQMAKVAHDTSDDLTEEVEIDLKDIGFWADKHFSLDSVEKQIRGKIFIQFANEWASNLITQLNLKGKIDILDLAIALGYYPKKKDSTHSTHEILDDFRKEYVFALDLLDKICHVPENLNPSITVRPNGQTLRDYLSKKDVGLSTDYKSWFGKPFKSIASEMTRSPFFQPLYQNKGLQTVLLISDFSLAEEYGIGVGKHPITAKHEVDVSDKQEAKNEIFFGPPGTGKTFHIQDELIDKYQSEEHELSKEHKLDLYATRLTWAETAAIALLDLGQASVSELMNHELVLAKSRVSNSKQVRRTLWGTLLKHVPLENEYVNVTYRQSPLFWKHQNNNKPYFTLWENLDDNELAGIREMLEDTKSLFSAQDIEKIDHFEFVTFHQAFSYEDFVEGIKPVLDDDSEGELEYQIEPGVFKRICERARRNSNQPHAIFIDEINRGNVASIFGELITLIEPDKREGRKNELSVTLPYSKEKFSVPSNLDIYGTMNTADRSVEALDTALRRRFEFKEIGPNWDKFDNKEFDGVHVGTMMRTINLRIEHLLDKDHCLGQSYFYAVTDFQSLQQVFAKHILPLLQEYFYGDFGKVGLILGDAFVKARDKRQTSFASFDHPDADLLQEKVVFDLQDPKDVEPEGYRAIYS